MLNEFILSQYTKRAQTCIYRLAEQLTLQAIDLSSSAHRIDGIRMLSFLFPHRVREPEIEELKEGRSASRINDSCTLPLYRAGSRPL